MRIFIDVGHGETGSDTGATGCVIDGETQIRENELNLRIAVAAKMALEQRGHFVTLSRCENKNITLPIGKYSQSDSNLIAAANRIRIGEFDFMVSIHNNASDNINARGFQLYYKTGNGKEAESKRMAECIGNALGEFVPKNMIGTRIGASGDDYYGILRLHDKIGVLCECGFLSNVEDAKLLTEKAEEIGRKIAEGINNYCGDSNDYKKRYEELKEKVRKALEILEEKR